MLKEVTYSVQNDPKNKSNYFMAVMRLCFPNQTVDRLGGWSLLYLIS